jgi:4'-phosphopantetheinyl transferase
MPLTEDERALIPLLSKQKRELCSKVFNPKPVRSGFYGEIIPLWLWSQSHPKRRRLPRVRYAKKGKPRIGFGSFHYSISHTDGGVFVALSDSPVGIDAEKPREVNFSVAERYFAPKDYAKLRHTLDPDRLYSTLWTRLEAYGKYLGVGIVRNLPLPPKEATTVTLPRDYIVSVYPPEEINLIPLDPEKVITDLTRKIKL